MADGLERIGAEVAACRACPRLVEWREQVAREKRAAFSDWEYWGRGVPAFGDPKAAVAVIGLAPAAHGANRTGRMFTGDRSGDWLYRALYRAGFANQPESVSIDDGLELTGAIVTSPVKCAPPGNKPTPAERAACKPFLVRELELVKPKVFVALGGFAYQALCAHLGVRPRPKFGHGVEVPTGQDQDQARGRDQNQDQARGQDQDENQDQNRAGPTILCSYHVSQQNTFTGRLTEEMLDAVFARARELAEA